MYITCCIILILGAILLSFKHLLKTLVVVELSMVAALLLLGLSSASVLKSAFLIVLAFAALEAALGFTLLVKLLRMHMGLSSMFMMNL